MHGERSGRVFLVTSTRQNIGNVVPLLTTLRAEDEVAWLESGAARRGHWRAGAAEVLRERGFVHQTTHDIGRSVADMRAAVAHLLAQRPGQRVVVVGNGGTKQQALVIWGACGPRMDGWVYSDGRRCAWLRMDAAWGEEVHAYAGPAGITLAEVLRCNGRRLAQEATPTPTRIWPAAGAVPLETQDYAREREATFRLHAEHARWAAVRRLATGQVPTWVQARDLLGEEYVARKAEGLYGALLSLVGGAKPKRGPRRVAAPGTLARRLRMEPQRLDSLWGVIRRVMLDAQHQRSSITAGTQPPSGPLGEPFERAVAARVVRFLDVCPEVAAVVSEVHWGVRCATTEHPKVPEGEFDVLLVLRNGVLLNLECKSFDADKKDLDARSTSLRRAASQLARTHVIFPVYTEARGEPWFQDQVEHWQRHAGVAFTLPGQPREACVEAWHGGPEAGADSKVRLDVPPFEAWLEQQLARFAPPAEAA